MQDNTEVIVQLNKILTFELTSINQYFLHARMFKNWGLEGLNYAAYKKSIKDMKQADELVERVLFLEGLPNLQHLERLRIGEHVEGMLNCDLLLQNDAIELLKESITITESCKDFVSRALLVNILEDEEEYKDWLEIQQYLIENSGIQNYIQSQIDTENE